MYSDFSNTSEVRRRGGNSTTTGFDQRSPATFSTSPNPSPTYGLDNIESFAKMASNSGRDRTSEFTATVKSLRGRNLMALPNGQNHTNKSRNELLAQQSRQFMNIAASIGRDIASTYTKLEKLTLLAKKRTLFDDRPQEIQELIGIIKQDTSALNKQIDQLNKISKAQQQTLRSKHQATHSTTVVAALQLRLASMTSDFKQVLEVRSENLRESKSRREQFSQGAVTHSMPQMDGYPAGSVLATAAMDDDEAAAQSNGQVAISMEQSSAMMQMQRGGDTSYLQSRADAMQNIESTIVELGGIFNQLATMIKEQEEIMVRIDSNVEDAAINVEAGHSEILKYFQSVTSNRWLMVKIFGVLIFFFIFFVIFMA